MKTTGQKISDKLKGRKQTPEHIRKRAAGIRKTCKKRKMGFYEQLAFSDFLVCEKIVVENPMNGMDYLCVQFIKPKFFKNFGPWKKNHKPYNLTFHPFDLTLVEGNQFNELVKMCKTKLLPLKPKLRTKRKS